MRSQSVEHVCRPQNITNIMQIRKFIDGSLYDIDLQLILCKLPSKKEGNYRFVKFCHKSNYLKYDYHLESATAQPASLRGQRSRRDNRNSICRMNQTATARITQIKHPEGQVVFIKAKTFRLMFSFFLWKSIVQSQVIPCHRFEANKYKRIL